MKKPLSRLVLLIVSLEFVALVALSGVMCLLEARTFKNKSEILADTLRNDFISGDLRTLHQKLQTALSQHGFLSLDFKGGLRMERPRKFSEGVLFDAKTEVPVLANVADPQSQISSFTARYSLVEPMMVGLILWLVFTVLILAFLPALSRYWARQIGFEQERLRKEREYQTARQVAHDIRTPLTALKLAAERITGAEQEKELISMACDRITKIAEDLLAKNSPETRPREKNAATEKGVAPVPALKEILEEMRMHGRIAIGLHAEGVPDQLLIPVDRVELQRAMVNLINNAIEATTGVPSPEIDVYLRFQNQQCSICLSDNGVGIPEDILKNLGQRGFTFGKKNGNGLGLHYAKTLFESVGGRVEIQSKVGIGTLVSIELPSLA